MKGFIYNVETNEATHIVESQDDIKIIGYYNENMSDHDLYGLTFSPGLGAVEGLKITDDTQEINVDDPVQIDVELIVE